MTATPALEADGLTRRFGERVAVDHVSFTVAPGEVFGFLGPNGAGKSTTARMLTGFLGPSEGRALVAGFDLARHASRARRQFGVVPEEANVYADLSVRQNVLLMAELHVVPPVERERRCNELLLTFDLAERAEQKGRQLSKGLRQRLMLCMALVSNPEVLFLDEPTSGLDVASTRMIREVIGQLNRERGMTVFLTTHNMDEANQLCHRFAAGHDAPAALMVPGIAAMALFFTASAVGPLVTPWERQARTLERLVTSPASLSAIIAGDVGAGAAFGAALALLPLGAGLALTAAQAAAPLPLLAGWLLGAAAFSSLGVLMAAPASDTPSQVMMLSNLVRLPLIFVSGVFGHMRRCRPGGNGCRRYRPCRTAPT
jgi:ABC-type Na+ transport system ATPase subunit NatA